MGLNACTAHLSAKDALNEKMSARWPPLSVLGEFPPTRCKLPCVLQGGCISLLNWLATTSHV